MLTMDRPLKTMLVFAALVAIGAGSRFAGIAPNATAIAGCALFASWIFRSRWLAVCVPLTSMAIADYFLGGYIPAVMASVYTCLALPALCGKLIGDRSPVLRSLAISLACACFFFLVTNFTVWASGANGYPRSIEGLAACFTNALPFFRLTLAGDLLSTLALFGGFVMVKGIVESRAQRLATV